MKDFLVWVAMVITMAVVGTINYYILPEWWNVIVHNLVAFMLIPIEVVGILLVALFYQTLQDRH